MTRNDKILGRITQSMKILEVGPSYSPVLRRADGWDCYSLDHSTAAELRAKYADAPNVRVSNIQEVDFVWRDGPLETAIPDNQLGTFDACIASHMIEHVPDLISFFRSMERILRPSGVISLVVPDKRFCFDYFQPITMTGDVLEAYRTRRTRHTRVAEFNAAAYMIRAGTDIAWGQTSTALLALEDGDLERANLSMFRDADDDSYRDVHAWYFTYSSFRLIMLELAWMGHVNFHEIDSSPTEHCEFFITLSRSERRLPRKVFDRLRQELLTSILLEVRQQTDFLIEGPNYVGPPSGIRGANI